MTSEHLDRLELKYHVDETTAVAIAASIAGICRPDRGGPYPVHSLYFDNAAGDCLRANELGLGVRCKLRVRGYPGCGDLWLERKAKLGERVRKHRVRLGRGGWPRVLDLHDPLAVAAGLGDPDSFLASVHRLRAVPALHVRYQREAWASDLDDYARITFDRDLRAAPAEGDPRLDPDDAAFAARMAPIDHGAGFDLPWSPVVLELKCHARMPRWLHALILRFGLQRTGTSKFAIGTQDAGNRRGLLAV